MTSNSKTAISPGLELIQKGTSIPAHPLALTEARRLDTRSQIALTRYYVDAGAGGVAVGVHMTQFAIREEGLYEQVLSLAAKTARNWTSRPFALVAGIAGDTKQAIGEAAFAAKEGYDAGLVSLLDVAACEEMDIIEHCCQIAERIPIIGFYIQSAVGGKRLSPTFWNHFAQIENAVAIKVAPFNQYATLDVIRGVVAAEAENSITLYTGNDDHIILDLTTPFSLPRDGSFVNVHIRGGLLGHWSVWTRAAVSIFDQIQQAQLNDVPVSSDLMSLNGQVTDCNSAFFDAANNFRGCIAGCNEVLRRQGLVKGIWCLDHREQLSRGQLAEIDRVYNEYPDLNDDEFVRENLDRWFS